MRFAAVPLPVLIPILALDILFGPGSYCRRTTAKFR